MGNHEEYGEIRILERVFDVAQTDRLGLEETDGGIGPAGTAGSLVLDRGDRIGLDGGECVVQVSDRRLHLRTGADAGAQDGSRNDKLLHIPN